MCTPWEHNRPLVAVTLGELERLGLAVMDQISFVISPADLSWKVVDLVEPVINGQSLVELVSQPEQEDFAGLDPICARRELGPPLKTGRVQLLGCTCGDERCSWVIAHASEEPDVVVWSAFRSSLRRIGDIAGLGPFSFDRAEYLRALEHPERRSAPLRVRVFPDPPTKLDGGRVLKYAKLTPDVEPTDVPGPSPAGKRLDEPFVGLAIVQYDSEASSGAAYLFQVYDDRQIVAGKRHRSPADALDEATSRYSGLDWVDVG